MSRRRNRVAPQSGGAETQGTLYEVEEVALELFVRRVSNPTGKTAEHEAQESFRLARIFCAEAERRLTLEEPRNGTDGTLQP